MSRWTCVELVNPWGEETGRAPTHKRHDGVLLRWLTWKPLTVPVSLQGVRQPHIDRHYWLSLNEQVKSLFLGCFWQNNKMQITSLTVCFKNEWRRWEEGENGKPSEKSTLLTVFWDLFKVQIKKINSFVQRQQVLSCQQLGGSQSEGSCVNISGLSRRFFGLKLIRCHSPKFSSCEANFQGRRSFKSII